MKEVKSQTLKTLENKMIKAIKCKWNWLLNMLMFDTDKCPYKTCTCKK